MRFRVVDVIAALRASVGSYDTVAEQLFKAFCKGFMQGVATRAVQQRGLSRQVSREPSVQQLCREQA